MGLGDRFCDDTEKAVHHDADDQVLTVLKSARELDTPASKQTRSIAVGPAERASTNSTTPYG